MEQRSGRDVSALAAAAFGAATICFLGLLCKLASPRHFLLFFWHGSAAALFLPVLLDLLLLSLLLFVLLAGARHHPRLRTTIWSALFLLLCVATFEDVYMFANADPPHWLKIPLFVSGAMLTIGCAIWLKSSDFERVRRAMQFLLQAAAFSGLLLFAEVIWCAFEARHLNDPPHAVEASVPVSDTAVRHHRIIWIILDELALRQAFLEQPRGESLPAFDALKAQSVLFTNVVPAAESTNIAIPSLMIGRKVLTVHSVADGQSYQIKTQESGWSTLNAKDTIFADAQSLGYHSAIAGWFIPYCRLLSGTFSYCMWVTNSFYSSFLSSETLGANLLNPLIHPGDRSTQVHLLNYLQLSDATDRVLKDKHYDFVYLHMPVPHPAGIYDRKSRTFALDHSVYVDNLALADVFLAHVRQLLEAQGEWDDATLLLMGDHSWRTMAAKDKKGWSIEDNQANHAGYDPRPAYILKLAHQQTGSTVNSVFQATRTRALLNALLRGQLHTSEDVQNWATTFESPISH
jgi:NADH:ubiquinone oxidoreductase subunit 6 (subunit J)